VREGVVRDLLADRARPATLRLVSYALASSRGRGLVSLLDWLVERAAAERGLRVADVRAAVDLDEDQRARLTTGLSRLIGRQVEVRVTVDPTVIGGVRILLGNTVIDGTVQHRLDQLRARLARGPAAGSRTGTATSVAGGTPRPAGDGHVTGEHDGGRGTDGSD
jgi:F-type H+-transporting ATPase subunit delta